MKPSKLKSYLILVISVILSGIVGYYLSNYFSSPIIPILLSSTLAIILVQLFELSLTQLKQRNYLVDGSAYSPETLKAIVQLQEKLLFINSSAKLFTLHWPTKQYVALNGGDAFSMQHSLVYASQEMQKPIHLNDTQYFARLPEVVALDIQSLLKVQNVNCVIPLGTSNSTYGFVLLSTNNIAEDEQINRLTDHASKILGQLLQHDAIVTSSKLLNSESKKSAHLVTWHSIVVLIIFFVLSIFWILTALFPNVFPLWSLIDFGNVYGLMALWGGICGIVVARQFREQKNMSRSFFMFALGLLFQEFGQLSYATYSYLWGTVIPYPSVGDIGFFGSVLCYIVGVFFLARATGITLKMRTFKNQALALIVPLLMLLIGYLLFLQDYQLDWNEPLRVFLDFGYPFFQSIYVSIAIVIYLLIFNTRGVTKNQIILIVVTLVWQFICDSTFLFQASRGTWEVNGWNDYMYFMSYTLMSLSLLQFIRKISSKTISI